LTQRQAYILYFAGALILEGILVGALTHFGADSETKASAIVLLLSFGGLGIGFIEVDHH
jgi:hypothetical protein